MANTRRAAARILRDRRRANQAAARIRRNGEASLTTHAIAQGLTPREARTVAASLRRNATKAGITGREARVHAGRRMRTAHRYTAQEVAAIATVYRPRKAAYADAANRLRLAA